MAKLIHCRECNKHMIESAKKYGELYEFIEGTAKEYLFCDGACFTDEGPKLIKQGEICYASCLLPSKSHPKYEYQKPEMWAHKFIDLLNQSK